MSSAALKSAREALETLRLRGGYVQHMCKDLREARLEGAEIERLAVEALALLDEPETADVDVQQLRQQRDEAAAACGKLARDVLALLNQRDEAVALLREVAPQGAFDHLTAEAEKLRTDKAKLVGILAARESGERERDDLRTRLAQAQRDASCGTCGGSPHPSGKVCVCGGSGRAFDEAAGLRRSCVDTQAQLAQVQKESEGRANAWALASIERDLAVEALRRILTRTKSDAPGLLEARCDLDVVYREARDALAQIESTPDAGARDRSTTDGDTATRCAAEGLAPAPQGPSGDQSRTEAARRGLRPGQVLGGFNPDPSRPPKPLVFGGQDRPSVHQARCSRCGWPLAKSRDEGCVEGDCSMRGERVEREHAKVAAQPDQSQASGGQELREAVAELAGMMRSVGCLLQHLGIQREAAALRLRVLETPSADEGGV